MLELAQPMLKNQYGQYLRDVLDGKYIDVIHDLKKLEKLEEGK